MRHLLAALLVSVSLAADAQSPLKNPGPTAPVPVAMRLYGDCLIATYSATREIEPSVPAIHQYVEEVDDRCLEWMVIWFEPLMGFSLLDRPDYIDRFNAARLRLLSEFRREIILLSKPR